MRNWVKTIVSYMVSFALLPLGVPVRAQGGSYEAAVQKLDGLVSQVEALRAELDRSAIDFGELEFEMIFADADEIIEWVEENISYQPYAGLLRGPEGTLLARSGNALDQSVLLASLLNGAGYDATVYLGQLDEADARELLATTAIPEPRDLSELRARLEVATDLDLGDVFDLTPDASGLAATRELSAGIVDTLVAAGLQLASNDADLLADAAEYAWVEYSLGGDQTTVAHPAAPFLGDKQLEATRVLDGGVPEDLQHRVRFEVLVESLVGSGLEVAPVMPAWERPAANATGIVIDYSNVPNTADMGKDLAEVLETSEFWVPTFMGGMPDGAQAFDMLGALLAPEDAANPMAGVFRQVRGGFMDAIGALGGMTGDDTGEPLALTAQWLVVTLVAPGGAEREFRRTVFDRVGPEARAAGLTTTDAMTREEAEMRLLSEHRLMVFPTDLPYEYLIDKFLVQMQDSVPLLKRALALEYGVDPEATLEQALVAKSPVEALLTSAIFDMGPANGVAWRAEPGLIMFSDSLAGDREAPLVRSSLDIINNARRTLGADGSLAALEQGVWETIAERDIMQDFEHNTANFGKDFVVTKPGDEAPSSLTPLARESMQRDLDAGYVTLTPQGADTWWRVDLATGETLGVTADGRGQSMTEYTIQLYDNAFTLMFGVISYDQCTRGNSSAEAQLCCLVRAHINNVMGMGLGPLVGAAGGAMLGGKVAGALMALSFNVTSGVLGTDLTNFVPGGVC